MTSHQNPDTVPRARQCRWKTSWPSAGLAELRRNPYGVLLEASTCSLWDARHDSLFSFGAMRSSARLVYRRKIRYKASY